MAAPADVIAEMRTLGIGKDVVDEYDDLPEETATNGHGSTREGVSRHRQAIIEISRMADKMSNLVQEIRNTSMETDERLVQIETDLRILGLEE